MADWTTIASMSTAGGTLVLAIATFSAVRSSQRSARVAEQSMLLGLRPVLAPSRPGDPPGRATFGDRHAIRVKGGMAAVDHVEDVYYFAVPVRNVGAGLAVIHSWRLALVEPVRPGAPMGAPVDQPSPEQFRRQGVDLYVAAGDLGMWFAAVRDADDPFRPDADSGVQQRQRMALDLLYGDVEGGQRTISRFVMSPSEEKEEDAWTVGVVRHWRLDGIDPRAV